MAPTFAQIKLWYKQLDNFHHYPQPPETTHHRLVSRTLSRRGSGRAKGVSARHSGERLPWGTARGVYYLLWVTLIPHSGLQREVTVGSKKGSQPPSTKASGKGFREGMAHRRRDPGNGLPCNETVIELSRVLQYSLRFT